MKTLQELYTEVMDSDALKTEFLALTTPEEIVAFAEKNGCPAALEEIKTFLEERAAATGELSDEELAQVAGGKSDSIEEEEVSIYSLGVGCAIRAIISAIGYQGRKGALCEMCRAVCAAVLCWESASLSNRRQE